MSNRNASERFRRLLPQTVRARLALLYAALFLAAGVALLALTYGLLDSALPQQPPGTQPASQLQQKLYNTCIGRLTKYEHNFESRVHHLLPKTVPSPADQCKKAFTAGEKAGSSTQRQRALHDLLLFSLLGLALMTLASGALGWFMAGRVLRPVKAITDTARRASDRHLGERLALEGPQDELKELADTFDQMLDRLDLAFATQRRFVADASHELRTPLTVMRTSIDVTLAKPNRTPEQLEEMAAKIRRSVDQAEKLIDALLTLAVSEQEPTGVEPVDLATLAEDALDTAAPEIRRLELTVDSDLEPALTAGDRLLLERLVDNLVTNAVRHNVDEGWIDVRTRIMDSRTVLTVTNSGRHIAEDRVPSLFEPFRKGDDRTNDGKGFGLGLAIVSSITTAHGGTVEAHGRERGGLMVTVSLPKAE